MSSVAIAPGFADVEGTAATAHAAAQHNQARFDRPQIRRLDRRRDVGQHPSELGAARRAADRHDALPAGQFHGLGILRCCRRGAIDRHRQEDSGSTLSNRIDKPIRVVQ